MSPDEIDTRIDQLNECFGRVAQTIERGVLMLEATAEGGVRAFHRETENRVGSIEVSLIPYVSYQYLSAEYHLACALFYASPGLIVLLIQIFNIIVTIWRTVKVVIDFLHIKELLAIADILSVIWPEFRTRMNKIYGKISEFSAQIGWGADGLAHMIQSAQSGVNVLGGVLGEKWSWVEIKGATKVVDSMQWLSNRATAISSDPGLVLAQIFYNNNIRTFYEVSSWWEKTAAWIETAADNAEKAIMQISERIGDLQELENQLPTFVRDNIPAIILDTLDWVDTQIDGTLLPAITQINRTLSEVNAVLEAHREKAASLVELLTRPGDVLLGIDKLTAENRWAQEDKIDDAASRKYERDTDKDEEEDAGIIAEFARISEALEAPPEPPAFLAIEEMPAHLIPGIVLEDRETWFVGDY